ncbi:MAG: ATPase [candidate division GAL15 bacterium]
MPGVSVLKPLIQRERIVGIFRGFVEGELEFHADLVLPYRPEYMIRPMHGHFLLVQLAHEDEAVLGRITALRSEGRLVSSEGEDYSLRSLQEGWTPPEDIRERHLKYRVNVRVLGVVRRDPSGKLQVAPSHRRLPHVGSPVAFPDDAVLRELAGHEGEGAVLGFLAMGEFVWGQEKGTQDPRLHPEPWMRVLEPVVHVRFRVQDLVARRTFVFARAGFGKSNLIKFLFSELYREVPTVPKRGGRPIPVGTLIFDREAEYFWPDDKGRPGLCDVPHLKDQVVVFTDREPPNEYYGSFVAGGVRLDLRRLPPGMVVGIALSPERQDQQNVRKLKALPMDRWKELIDLIHRKGYRAPIGRVAELLGMEEDDRSAEVEATAARSNMMTIVRMLHDPHSRFLDLLVRALRDGKLCVVDLSRMSGEDALAFSGIVLQYLFDRNQEEFVKREPATIPVIAVLEEAQSVLGQGSASSSPYVRWVKEGRKYDLGAVMVTQQPGSIPEELLSQGDNWFVFHVLSSGDLRAVGRANAHFSLDLLSSLLNEPIPGHCVFWSGVSGRPYPIPIRVVSFERMYPPQGHTEPVETYARQLRAEAGSGTGAGRGTAGPSLEAGVEAAPDADYLSRLQEEAFRRVRQDGRLRRALRERGEMPWRELMGCLSDAIHGILQEWGDRILERREARRLAYQWVRPFLERHAGREDPGQPTSTWTTRPGEHGKQVVVFSEEARRRLLEG